MRGREGREPVVIAEADGDERSPAFTDIYRIAADNAAIARALLRIEGPSAPTECRRRRGERMRCAVRVAEALEQVEANAAALTPAPGRRVAKELRRPPSPLTPPLVGRFYER